MSIEVSTGEEPYLIVSSDTHAGLQCEDYRPYLDSSLHEEFDKYVESQLEGKVNFLLFLSLLDISTERTCGITSPAL